MTAKKLLSLVFVRRQKEVLLGLKKRGFGEGKWNGFGGKVEPNETILQGAVREVKEECGLDVTELRKIALIEFEFENHPVIMEVHVFDTWKFDGKVVESEEMRPQWFDLGNVPFDKMWPDDAIWWPYMLRNETFKGYFLYGEMETIIKHKLERVDSEKLDVA